VDQKAIINKVNRLKNLQADEERMRELMLRPCFSKKPKHKRERAIRRHKAKLSAIASLSRELKQMEESSAGSQ